MDKLTALRLSETMDEDGVTEEEMREDFEENRKKSPREKYKEFYSDIKFDASEDW